MSKLSLVDKQLIGSMGGSYFGEMLVLPSGATVQGPLQLGEDPEGNIEMIEELIT